MEIIASIFGLICVYLTIKQNIWCWPTGLIQVILYIVVFFEAKLYSDSILQIIYVVLQIYGWRNWLYGGNKHSELPVSKLNTKANLNWLFIGIVGSSIWGYSMANYTDASAPYPDAIIVVMSLIAQWLMAKKKLESWYFWILVDILAIGVYLYKDLLLTSALYAVFLVLAIMGFIEWRRSMTCDEATF